MCDISLLSQEKQSLKTWGLPKIILEKYAAKGVESMFPWQVECLTCDGVLTGRNLIYSAPTSAGKTMVSEILTIQTVLERKKKVIFILPFISIVREKTLYFRNLLGSSGVRVEGFMGSHAPPGGLRSVHIAVCTIEKANSLINRLLEEQGLEAVGCVVVDEIHLLGDPHRGYLLELLLTKLKFMCSKDKSLKIQIVGMSATLPNISELSDWLDAALYTTEFRPIPLAEYIKIDDKVYDASTMELKSNIQPIAKFKSDPGDVVHLCLEALLAGHSVVVFCPSRSQCETSAQLIAVEFRRIGYEKTDVGLAVRAQLNGAAISDVLEQLKRCPAGLDQSLGRSVAFGVAFHHAGLTMDERDIVEGAFRASVLRVLVATSTLSSGVNLPARRVLVRCPPRNAASDVLMYRQMVGRAGRMGKDTAGESFLICNGSERVRGEQLVRSQLPAVESSLGSGDLSSSLKRAILEVIASGVVKTSEDLEAYTACTFFASCGADDSSSGLGDPLASCVEYLQANEFIRVTGAILGPTPLAEACLSASLPPDQGLKLLKELHRARQCFVLESELHVIYQVTPYSVSDQWGEMDWLRVLSIWEDLPISMKRVGELVGVEEGFLVKAVRGTVNYRTSAQKLSIHRRFYTALALQDLVSEVPLPQVAVKFNCTKGMLQSLQQSSSTFAGMVTQFTRRLGWSNVELLVSQFCARLQFGAQRELLDLLRLDCLTAVQARALYNAGVQGLGDLASASAAKVEKALARATPFHSESEEDAESSEKCRVWLAGHCAATEAQAANILILEARQYVERELGLQDVNWGDSNATSESSASESLLTQSLVAPSQPIGQEVAAATSTSNRKHEGKSKYESRDFLKDVEQKVSEKKEEQVDSNHEEDKQTKKKTEEVNKISNKKNISENLIAPNMCSEHEPTTQSGSSSNLEKRDAVPLKESKNSKAENKGNSEIKKERVLSENVEPSVKVSNNSVTAANKRGSLDLFDSPDRAENVDSKKLNGINIEEKNVVLSTRAVKVKEELRSAAEIDQRTESERAHIANVDNQPHLESKSEEREKLKRASLMDTVDLVPQSQQNNKKPSNNKLSIDSSLFFSSPVPNGSDGPENISFLNELDANFGGDGLLELSSFIADVEDKDDMLEGDINVLDENVVGEHSFLEMSSIISETGNKRKRSVGEANSAKRIRRRSNLCQAEVNISFGELQVPNISSTGHNNYDKVDDENFGNPASKHNFESKKLNTDEGSSLDLEFSHGLSEDGFLWDSKINIDSNISDNPDCGSVSPCVNNKNKESVNQNALSVRKNVSGKSSIFSESFNMDSKLNELCDVRTSIMNEDDRVKEVSNLNVANVVQSKENDEDSSSCSQIVNSDSKLNLITDVKAEKPNDNDDGQAFSSFTLNLNTQLCGMIDQVSSDKNSSVNKKLEFNNESEKQFGESNFNVNTQLCNVLDNLNVSNKENHSVDKKPVFSETMEIDEIKNLNFDEDTVFGTPLVHQKSMSFKSFATKKTKPKNLLNQKTDKTKVNYHCSFKNNPDGITSNAIDFDSKVLECQGKQNNTPNIVCNKKSNYIKQASEKENLCSKPNLVRSSLLEKSSNSKTETIPPSTIPSNCKTETIPPSTRPSNCKNETLPPPSTGGELKQSVPVCSLITNSFLDGAFDQTFDRNTEEVADDEVVSSQKTPVTTPHKSLRERIKNVNSPTVNMNCTQVQVVEISVDNPETRKEFQKSVAVQKSVSIALSVRQTDERDCAGAIGARIVKRKTENKYPCCHDGTAVTEVVVCWGDRTVYTLSLDEKCCTDNLELLRGMLSCKQLIIHVWEAKQAVKLLLQCCRLRCEAKLSDPTVAEWLLKPHVNTPTLKQLARTYGVSAPQCSVESGFQALLVQQLCRLLKSKLKQLGLYSSYTDIEMPTQMLLAEMEITGVRWDREYADLLWISVEEKMVELQNTLFSLSGKKFNLRSRTDLAKIKLTMKGSSEDILAEFNSILRSWRVLNSLKTRNMSSLMMQEGERVRGSWESHTLTGRVTMQEPSLQHVPRDITVHDQVFSLRSAFTAGKGNTIVSADFCQLELRLLAHFSQEPALHLAFSRPGDVFIAIASEWNNVPVDQVSDALRQHTKQLCYGLVYGMGLRSLATEMDIDEGRAGEMVERFHQTFPGVQVYVGHCVEQCRALGYVTTLMGRRRYLPEITSHNKSQRAQAERQAVNTTVQGSAADIAKVAMLRVNSTVRRRGLQAQLIIHLHDELIYEVAQENEEEFVKVLRKEMEGAVDVSVPLPVRVKKGPSWGQLDLVD